MKKLSAIALCALLAAATAQATTYYVDASRPNNNGNGLKLATAKKTIQSAINLSKNGDTILVYPGVYTPIQTNDKKITIKAVKGAAQTKIAKTTAQKDIALAQLGKTLSSTYVTTEGVKKTISSAPYSLGQSTTLTGFLLDGLYRDNDYYTLLGVSGGTVKNCTIRRLGDKNRWWNYTTAAQNASLVSCAILENNGAIADHSVLSRCRIRNNASQCDHWYLEDTWLGSNWISGGAVHASRLVSCLLAGNRFFTTSGSASSHFSSSTLVNCTIVKNRILGRGYPFASKSKFYNCILWNNWRGESGKTIRNVDSGNTYTYTNKDNKNPKFVDEAAGDFKLAKGSPFIDAGKIQDAIKSWVGTLDAAGQKRIRGNAIDRGCYEY